MIKLVESTGKVSNWASAYGLLLHPGMIFGKVFIRLRGLWVNAQFSPFRSLLNLVKSLLIPLVTSSDSVLPAGLDANAKKMLQRASNACVSYIYKLKHIGSVRNDSHRILGCEILTYLEYRTCCVQIFKLVRSGLPNYIWLVF